MYKLRESKGMLGVKGRQPYEKEIFNYSFRHTYPFMQINAKHIEANSAIVDESTVKLRILETTDIHSYLLDYNYEKKRKRLNSDITELLV